MPDYSLYGAIPVSPKTEGIGTDIASFEPNYIQRLMLKELEVITEPPGSEGNKVAVIASRRSGKTTGLVLASSRYIDKNPKAVVSMVSHSDAASASMWCLYNKFYSKKIVRKSKGWLELDCGATLRFNHLKKNTLDYGMSGSHSDLLLLDEVTHLLSSWELSYLARTSKHTIVCGSMIFRGQDTTPERYMRSLRREGWRASLVPIVYNPDFTPGQIADWKPEYTTYHWFEEFSYGYDAVFPMIESDYPM